MNRYKRRAAGYVCLFMGIAGAALDIQCGGTLAKYFGDRIHQGDVVKAEEQFGPFMKMIEELN